MGSDSITILCSTLSDRHSLQKKERRSGQTPRQHPQPPQYQDNTLMRLFNRRAQLFHRAAQLFHRAAQLFHRAALYRSSGRIFQRNSDICRFSCNNFLIVGCIAFSSGKQYAGIHQQPILAGLLRRSSGEITRSVGEHRRSEADNRPFFGADYAGHRARWEYNAVAGAGPRRSMW